MIYFSANTRSAKASTDDVITQYSIGIPVHIQLSDEFNGLQKIYWLYFSKSYSWEDYVEEQMKELKKNVFKYRDSFLTNVWKNNVDIVLSHLDVLACISYVDEQFFNDIVERLKNK